MKIVYFFYIVWTTIIEPWKT